MSVFSTCYILDDFTETENDVQVFWGKKSKPRENKQSFPASIATSNNNITFYVNFITSAPLSQSWHSMVFSDLFSLLVISFAVLK